MPAVFIANSSRRSPKLPKVMSDAISTASGNACGTSVSANSQKNLARKRKSRPLPTMSSAKRQSTFINNTKRQMANAATNSSKKLLRIKISSLFGLIQECKNFQPAKILQAERRKKDKVIFYSEATRIFWRSLKVLQLGNLCKKRPCVLQTTAPQRIH